MKTTLSLVALIGTLAACAGPHSRTQSFDAMPVEGRIQATVILGNLSQKLEEMGLRIAEIIASSELEGSPDEPDWGSLRIRFRTVSPAVCNLIRTTYADGWKDGMSGTDCSRGGELELRDFLTPMMQATVWHSFAPEQEIVETRAATRTEFDQYVPDFWKQAGASAANTEFARARVNHTNCWSTAFEAARRHPDQLTVHYMSPEQVEEIFSDPAHAKNRSGTSMTAGALKAWLARWSAAFGDMLLVRRNGSLVHAAVFVDTGVLYEKTSVIQPYRLTSLDKVLATYEDAQFSVYRTLKDFPHVAGRWPKTVTMDYMERTIWKQEQVRREVMLEKDEQGHFRLPREAFERRLEE